MLNGIHVVLDEADQLLEREEVEGKRQESELEGESLRED